MKYSILLFCLFFSHSLFSQDSFQNDFRIFKKALLETHPSLYRFTPKEYFDKKFDSIENRLQTEVTELEFFRMLSEVEALIREVHSFVRPSPKLKEQMRKAKLFPFDVHFIENRLFIKKSRVGDYKNLEDHEILEINGKKISSLLQKLEQATGYKSGYNNSFLKYKLSQFNNFSFFYYLYLDTTGEFKITYQDAENNTNKIAVVGTNNNLNKAKFPQRKEETLPPFSLEIDEAKCLAKMKITTFAYWIVGMKPKDYSEFFESSFEKIAEKNIKTLIIDVRGNSGGEEKIAVDLLTYLSKKEIITYNYIRTKTLDYGYTNKLSEGTKIKFKERNFTKTDSFFYLKKDKALQPNAPKVKNCFDGKVYILQNGGCASATNIFLDLAKSYQLATLVGTESGGVHQYVDGIWHVKFTLPYSKVEVYYPAWSMKINANNGLKNRGILPNIKIIEPKDENTQLEKLYNIIMAENSCSN